MATGYEEALRREADIVVKLDGDGQMDPPFMRHLVEPIAEEICDYAKGNRFLHFQALKKMPWSRKVGNISRDLPDQNWPAVYWHTFDPRTGVPWPLDRLPAGAGFGAACGRGGIFSRTKMLIRLNVDVGAGAGLPDAVGCTRGEVSSLRISKVLTYFPYS
jgi:hypothetical protein